VRACLPEPVLSGNHESRGPAGLKTQIGELMKGRGEMSYRDLYRRPPRTGDVRND